MNKENKGSKKGIKKDTILIIVLSILFVIDLALIIFLLYTPEANVDEKIEVEEKTQEEVIEIKDEYKDIFNEFKNKAYNKDDYKCQIIFKSGIINEPVVQGKNNDEYLRKDFETYKYRVDGPIFIDSSYIFNEDLNMVLYGHNMPRSMDEKQEQLFTPLHRLEDRNNYEDNKIVYLIFEDHQEEYEVVFVYNIKVTEEEGVQYLNEGEPLYYLNNYSEEEFDEYVEAVKQREYYSTNVDVSSNDRLLTLQTCYEDKTDKLVVVAKMINEIEY